MNFVALILGLAIERLLTHLFHLREFRWLDPLFDSLFQALRGASKFAALLGIAAFTVAAVLPVALVSAALIDQLLQIPYFVFAVFVLLVSLGPRDLKEEVDEFCLAVDTGKRDDIRQLSRELLERNPPEDEAGLITEIRDAVFMQANNRIFGVAFWFVLLGPTGAWAFRVLDLMRRRLAFRKSDLPEGQDDVAVVWAARTLQGVFAWIPSRLVAVGYALAGSFEQAIAGWKRLDGSGLMFYENSERLLAGVGAGALTVTHEDEGSPVTATIRSAWDLVLRTLWLIWCPVLAVLTLYNWMT